jgi:hypothetical protein
MGMISGIYKSTAYRSEIGSGAGEKPPKEKRLPHRKSSRTVSRMSRTAFDASKDKLIERAVAFEDPYNRISVALHSYNGAAPKIQITRERSEKGNWGFAKTGRLTYDEFAAIARAVKQLWSNRSEKSA